MGGAPTETLVGSPNYKTNSANILSTRVFASFETCKVDPFGQIDGV